MEDSVDESEVKDLSEIYELLKGDAKEIVLDLRGGVTMWREAAAGALASAGFIAMLILTFLDTAASKMPAWESTAIVGFYAAVGVMMSAIAVWGLRRYFQLRRRYAGLFQRAQRLK